MIQKECCNIWSFNSFSVILHIKSTNMKNIAMAATAAITSLLLTPAAIGAVTPQPLPEGVVAVYPSQGYIDTSENQYPLGAGSISVEFQVVPEANPACNGLICIYVDGAQEPAETLVAGESAFVDAMGYPMGGFNFTRAYADPGTYTVTIPEGAWKLSGTNSPAITLSYEIRRSHWLTPAPGIVDEISQITMTVAGTNVKAESESVRPELLSGIDTYPLTVVVTPNTENPDFTDIIMMPEATLTEAKDYTLFIPGGCYSYIDADGEKCLTQEVVAIYSVPFFPQPECSPADGSELQSFSNFTLTYPEGYVPIVTDDMGYSYIYPVMADGNPGSSYTYRLKEVASNDTGVTIGILGDDNKYQPGTEYTPADGEYVLKVMSGLFSGFWGEEFINNPEYTYHFTINSAGGSVETAPAAEGKVTIVRPDGTVLARDADPEIIKSLPKGIYIVNGKLVYGL